MAHICRNRTALLLAGALWPALAIHAADAVPDFSGLPVSVDAASSEIDARTNTLVFRNVVISQGNMRVQAEHAHATGLDFANSRWDFEGNVRIDAEQHGNLRSESAVVEFKDNHIARATITGKPAEFEQKRANSDAVAHGHADEILYDVNDGTVRLTDEAWLSDGQNEISGPLLVYNIREQQIQAAAAPNAAAGSDQRVHISIAPRAAATGKPEAARPDAAKPATARPDAARPDAARPDAARPDAPRPDAPRPAAAQPGPDQSAPAADAAPKS
ncbi:MAG TPA: lipopolysaccharide transport periplasmic protein LptA [Steroidobacteraceae bacterium]|nr:lipopolysaccharide transport periplasmic protein LptA [Steroidobacteraceae bacterium]